MSRIMFKQVDEISRTTVSCAQTAFLRHCKLKNLSSYTSLYYEKNLDYFLESEPQIKYVDEIDQEVIEDYIGKMMERGNRVTAIKTRLRAVFTFLHYCFDQEYTEEFPLHRLKEDETFKEPYTDAEMQKLLRKPRGTCWVESGCIRIVVLQETIQKACAEMWEGIDLFSISQVASDQLNPVMDFRIRLAADQ